VQRRESRAGTCSLVTAVRQLRVLQRDALPAHDPGLPADDLLYFSIKSLDEVVVVMLMRYKEERALETSKSSMSRDVGAENTEKMEKPDNTGEDMENTEKMEDPERTDKTDEDQGGRHSPPPPAGGMRLAETRRPGRADEWTSRNRD
jgi:hypothetical protein